MIRYLAIGRAAAALFLSGALAACGGGASSPAGSAGISPQSSTHSGGVLPEFVMLSRSDAVAVSPAGLSQIQIQAAGVPAVMNSWVSVSAYVSGVPCFNCVGNPFISGTEGIASAQPDIPLGSTVEYTFTFESISEAAACTIAFSIKQGTKTLGKYSYPYTLAGNTLYLFYHYGSLPKSIKAGAAIASANVSCPGLKIKPVNENIYL